MMMVLLPLKVHATFKYFNTLVGALAPRGVRALSTEEYDAAFLYILTNIPEMDEHFK